MERRSSVTAATGALGPVLTKLTDLLDDRTGFVHLERWREDIQFVKSGLGSVYSLLLKIWDTEDLRLDPVCNEWMADARRLSYIMEEDIDGILAGSSGLTSQPKTDAVSPFEGLKNQVQFLLNRCSEDWEIMGRIISEHRRQPEPNVDPRSEFLHNDASELVEIDDKKRQLIRFLEEHHTVCIVGSAGMGKTTLADLVYHEIGKKFERQAFLSLSRRPDMTRVLTSLCTQVMASAITNKRKAVTDRFADTVVLEWERHYSPFIQDITDILKEEKELVEEENELINNIVGFFGREVTGSTYTQLQGTAAEEKLIKSITVFLESKEWKRPVDDHNNYLKKIISKLLEDKSTRMKAKNRFLTL